MSGTTLHNCHYSVGYQAQYITGFGANVLDSLVTGGLIQHITQAFRKCCIQLSGCMTEHQVLKRIVKSLRNPANVRVIREHQWQLLLEHQHTGRHQRNKVPAIVYQPHQRWNVPVFGALYRH